LKTAVAALFIVLLVVALMRGTSERTDDMQITGAAPEVSTIARQAPMPSPGQPGGVVEGVPPALKPKPSQRVDRARARVSMEANNPIAWAELGYALLDAEGWIDAFQTAQKLREIAPDSADARVIEAMVRVPMGQADTARSLLDEALAKDTDHVMALTARGMLHYSSGELAAAKTDWTHARDLAGPGQGHDELLAMAETPPARVASAPAMPTAVQTTGASATGKALTGQIILASGQTAPNVGVIFIYARHPGQTSGPPVAVKRISQPNLPLVFSLGPADQMIKGMPFPELLDLSARWDLDGNAMTKGPEDLRASQAGIAAGSGGIELQLAKP
jgi:hypothetical protein